MLLSTSASAGVCVTVTYIYTGSIGCFDEITTVLISSIHGQSTGHAQLQLTLAGRCSADVNGFRDSGLGFLDFVCT